MIRLMLALVAAQLLDLGTAYRQTEVNAVVLHLGASAPLAKLSVIVLVLAVAVLLERTHQRPVAVVLLVAGIAVGLVGALSNVVAAA